MASTPLTAPSEKTSNVGNEIEQALNESSLELLKRAREAVDLHWPFLQGESDLPDAERGRGEKLADLIAKETFFRELPNIDSAHMCTRAGVQTTA